MQGKTDEAKSDLSRLAKIRAEEAAQAKRKAEADGIMAFFCALEFDADTSWCLAKAQEAEAKKQAQIAKRG